jgi:hypothetical protein
MKLGEYDGRESELEDAGDGAEKSIRMSNSYDGYSGSI